MKKLSDLLKGELIGLKAKVYEPKNKANLGLEGEIIDETRNTITIKTKGKSKKIIKDQTKIMINGIKIDGKDLVARPEERTKKWLRKKIVTSASR